MATVDKDNLLITEYTLVYGGFPIDMVAIFNRNTISETEVKKIIQSGMEDDQVIIVTKTQYDNVFGKIGRN